MTASARDFDPMNLNEEAFQALEAIRCNDRAQFKSRARWIEAFKTIRWAIETREGPTLTSEGLRALVDMAAEKRRG